ncbi:U6 snRNA phosphodiesterase 1-like [Ostrea edulis]|uniref:U6 snRNA phosphodiesterase 1-like n=1 Tax=Ostrea edulis TaxID=37623 RepID=UPI0024AF46BA|nr:U6 snRNA phosphodiesterase 1-like [Ostrea edulis]XP_056012091.1 U6 snRNA phosphodiesterase 1-like [Ostrea edulis]
MLSMSSLVQYSDSEDGGSSTDNDDSDRPVNSNIMRRKRSQQSQNNVGSEKKTRTAEFLPLPDTIKSLFSNEHKHLDNSENHEGRTRSFEHLEGNWATHINVPYNPDERMIELIEELLMCLRPFDFKPMKELHLSLSRTVAIRHHWIKPLTESLQNRFKLLPRTCCEISSVKLYTNDEKTRTFLSLTVSTPGDILHEYTQAVDECFEEYKLQKYYENPSYHMSIGWCLCDVIQQISRETLNTLQETLDSTLKEHIGLKLFAIEEAICKTGNKQFSLQLSKDRR